MAPNTNRPGRGGRNANKKTGNPRQRDDSARLTGSAPGTGQLPTGSATGQNAPPAASNAHAALLDLPTRGLGGQRPFPFGQQGTGGQQPFLDAAARAQERQRRANAERSQNQYNQQNPRNPQEAPGSFQVQAASTALANATGPNLASLQLRTQQQILNQDKQQNYDQFRQANPNVQGQPLLPTTYMLGIAPQPVGAVKKPDPGISRKRPLEDPEDPENPSTPSSERKKRAKKIKLAASKAASEEKAHNFRLQAHCDRIDFYRRGKYKEWNIPNRQPIFTAKPPGGPLSERFLTFKTMQTRRDKTVSSKQLNGEIFRVYIERGRYLAARIASHIPLYAKPKNETARVAINSGAKGLAAAGARFVRILGQGGYGIAALFELKNQTTGATERIVVKFNSREGGTIDQREKFFLKILKRSRHIVQLASLKEVHESLGNKNFDEETLQAIKERDADDDMIILKYCDRDNLSDFICLTAFHGARMTNRVLWNFVECLGRGCMAMRAPVRLAGDAQETLPEEGPLITESTKWPKRGLNLVHLDLDPMNIFMSEDPEAHPEMPQLLVADFGIAQSVSNQVLNCYNSRRVITNSRGCKPGFWAPEQFTDQWDEVVNLPFEQFYKKNGSLFEHLEPQPGCIAGAIGYWTNVWMSGMIIWCCITQMKPLSPLVPSTSDKGVAAPAVWWHYAYPLLHPTDDEFSDVDPDLKELVCRMLAHEPCNRPTPVQIVETAMKKLKDLDGNQDNRVRADFDAWYQKMQPAPSDPVYQNPEEPFPDPIGHIPPVPQFMNPAPAPVPAAPAASIRKPSK